jgi:hypothetical protein
VVVEMAQYQLEEVVEVRLHTTDFNMVVEEEEEQ